MMIKKKTPYEESFVHHEDVLFSMTKTLKTRHFSDVTETVASKSRPGINGQWTKRTV